MGSLLTGDMALESLEIAEDDYLMFPPVEDPWAPKPKQYEEFQPNRQVVMGVSCLVYFRDDRGWMGVWRKGDIWFDGTEYKYVPDSWDFEDVRLDEVVYRPI